MSETLFATRQPTLYEQLADEIDGQIQAGTFECGDRLPSVRQVSQQKGLSVTTVLQAYHLLEDRGRIEARPQSGYYVRAPLPPPRPRSRRSPASPSTRLACASTTL